MESGENVTDLVFEWRIYVRLEMNLIDTSSVILTEEVNPGQDRRKIAGNLMNKRLTEPRSTIKHRNPVYD